MKGSGALVASALAASTVALSSCSAPAHQDVVVLIPCANQISSFLGAENAPSSSPNPKDKFAPRFDGLRFIETLITAHR